MSPGEHNFTIYRGVSFGPKVLIFKDGTGVVVDLTGFTPKATARVDGVEMFDLEPTLTSAVGGEVTMEKTLDEVMDLPAGFFEWDMTFEDVAGERIGPFVYGTIHVPTLNTLPEVIP